MLPGFSGSSRSTNATTKGDVDVHKEWARRGASTVAGTSLMKAHEQPSANAGRVSEPNPNPRHQLRVTAFTFADHVASLRRSRSDFKGPRYFKINASNIHPPLSL